MPSTIRSSPFWNGPICPVRVSEPSAKMQTSSPFLTASFAVWSDRSNAFGPPAAWEIDTPAVFDQVTEHVPASVVRGAVLVSADLGQHAAWLASYAELGFDEIALHHVGKEQRPFLEAFGDKVLPQLQG